MRETEEKFNIIDNYFKKKRKTLKATVNKKEEHQLNLSSRKVMLLGGPIRGTTT